MLAEFQDLLAAIFAFVVGHFLLSSAPLRTPLVQRLGEKRFAILYSLLIGAAMVWMLLSYGASPYYPVWEPPYWLRHLTFLLMIPSVFFVVVGLLTPSPTIVGGEARMSAEDPTPAARGILSITRHPFLVGVSIYAIAHLLVRGDLASVMLFVGLLVLCIGGMFHIDMKRSARLGSLWGPVAMTTSRTPFLAVAQGRCKLDLAGIGWWRPLVALAIYAVLLVAHPVIAGIALVNI